MGFIMQAPCRFGCGKQRGFNDTGKGEVIHEQCNCKGQKIADAESELLQQIDRVKTLENHIQHLKEMGIED